MQPVIPQDEFLQRRERVLSRMPQNTVAIVSGHSELTRSNDTEYPFRQNSYFHYLTGFNEPDAVLVLTKIEDSQVFYFVKIKIQSPRSAWASVRLP